jgi:myosin heavy subunit
MSQSPTKQLDAAGGAAEDDYGEWSIDLKSNAFEGAMKEISSGFELERAAFEREFLTKFRELRRPITKEIIDTVNSGRAAIEVVNEFFDKAIVEVMGFMHGRRELEDALQGKLMHATHHVFETGVDAMLRRDREKKAFLKQSYETRIEESRISSKVEQSNSTLVLEAKYERQIFELKERLVREADAMAAALRSKDEDIRVAHAQFNSKLAAEKAGAKHYAEQLKTDLESAKSQLELLRKSTQSTSSAKSVLESERKALSDEMARLVTLHKEERHRNEVQMHKLRTELDDVKASQAAERKKIKDTTEQASKQLEAAHDQLRSMQFELQSMQQSVDVSNVRLAESEGSLKDLYGRYRESQSILSETLSSKEDHEKAALIAQDAIIELTREKEELLIMLQDCKAQMAVGEAKLAELQAELEAVLKAQERSRKKLLESEMKVTMLNTDVSAARSRLKELEDEVAALKEEIESLRIARDAAANSSSSKSSILAQQLHDLQQEFDDARAVREVDKQGSEEVIAALRSRIAELESRPVSEPPQPHVVAVPLVARSAEDKAAHEHGKQDAAVVRAATPLAAAAHNVDTHTEPTTQHVRAAAEAVSPQSSQDAVSLGERPRPAPAPALPDATGRASHSATRMSIKSAEASDSDSARLTSADSDQSKPDSRDSNPFSAASAQSSMRAPSVALSHFSSLADDAPQTRGNYSASDTRASKEGQRMTTASIVSTSSGLSVSGMSGVQAAAVFMNDAGRTVLVDSASEVTTVV